MVTTILYNGVVMQRIACSDGKAGTKFCLEIRVEVPLTPNLRLDMFVLLGSPICTGTFDRALMAYVNCFEHILILF